MVKGSPDPFTSYIHLKYHNDIYCLMLAFIYKHITFLNYYNNVHSYYHYNAPHYILQ